MELCRRVIRVNMSKERIEKGKIAELNLPKTIQDYLEYKERRTAVVPTVCDVESTATSASSAAATAAASTHPAAAAVSDARSGGVTASQTIAATS